MQFSFSKHDYAVIIAFCSVLFWIILHLHTWPWFSKRTISYFTTFYTSFFKRLYYNAVPLQLRTRSLLLNHKTMVSLSSPKIPFYEVRYLMDCLSRTRILQVKQCQPLQKTLNRDVRSEHLYQGYCLSLFVGCVLNAFNLVEGAHKYWHKDPTSFKKQACVHSCKLKKEKNKWPFLFSPLPWWAALLGAKNV